MSIRDEGFLSPDIEIQVERNRTEYSDWLLLARSCNRFAQKMLLDVQMDTTTCAPSKLVTVALFIRLLSSFQGAVLLAERSMEVEARTLTRACLETVFVLGAVVNDGDAMVREMYADMVARRRSQANWTQTRPEIIKNLTDKSKFNLDMMNQLACDAEKDIGKLNKINYENLANRSGFPDHYIWYRILSGDSAHATAGALARYHLDDEGARLHLAWGPDCTSNLAETLALLCDFLISGIYIFDKHMPDECRGKAIQTLFEQFRGVVRASGF